MKGSQPNGPGHPIVGMIADHWHVVCGVIMASKLGTDHVVITPEDIRKATAGPERAVVVRELSDGLHVHFVPVAEAQRMQREHLN